MLKPKQGLVQGELCKKNKTKKTTNTSMKRFLKGYGKSFPFVQSL